MAAAVMQPDRQALAQRIQGFGNVNPPPLEEETAGGGLSESGLSRATEVVCSETLGAVFDHG